MSCFYKTNKTDGVVCTSGSNFIAASFPMNDAMTDFHVWFCVCNLTQEPFFPFQYFPVPFQPLLLWQEEQVFPQRYVAFCLSLLIKKRSFSRFIMKFGEILYFTGVLHGFKHR